MIAILTHKVDWALDELKRNGNLESYSPSTRRGEFVSGRQFVIATAPEHVVGLRLSDYIVTGHPSDELREAARARMTV